MQVSCPACHAELRVAPSAAEALVECRRCGAAFVPADLDDVVQGAQGDQRPKVIVVLVALFGFAALLQGSSALGQFGGARFALVTTAPALALVSLCLGVVCVVAMVGLWRLRQWGWWTGTVALAVSVLLNSKLLAPLLLALKWDHPRALEVLGSLVLFFGLPIVAGLALLALLAAPAVRLATGVKDRPLQARRRIIGRPPLRARER